MSEYTKAQCAIRTSSSAAEPYPTAEAYFIDRDMFVEYVRAVLNPARAKEGLSVCTPAVASHLFDVITSQRYRHPDKMQDGAAPSSVGTGELVSVSWQTGIPDVKEGGSEAFWCAIRGDNGKMYHRVLQYQNAYVMPLADSCDDAPANAVPVGDDGDYAWTGWIQESCDQCETQWTFDKPVIAWMRLPRFNANIPVRDGEDRASHSPST